MDQPTQTASGGLGWAILGTAHIAKASFLPALAEAGGSALVVGSRDGTKAEAFATSHGVGAGVEGYRAAIEHPGVEAVYIALPNSLHAEWAAAAAAAGKSVLCEKPLCTSAAEAEGLIASVADAPGLLWEAFVFPFQAQMARLSGLLADGAIGELREITASFHFPLTMDPSDIRLQRDLGGGCLGDVGCYPLRLAQLLFAAAPTRARSSLVDAGQEVEVEAAAVLEYPEERRMLLTCGFRRAQDTSARLMGTEGSIVLTSPYHPRPADSVTLLRPGKDPVVEHPTTDRYSFAAALRHITAVAAGDTDPAHLASDDSLATAQAIEMVAAGS